MIKLVYWTDEKGYFKGVVKCQLDPLESKKQNKEVYLLPKNSLEEEPPSFKKGEIAFWNGTSWEIRENNIGKLIYNKKSGGEVVCQTPEIPELFQKEPVVFESEEEFVSEEEKLIMDKQQEILRRLAIEELQKERKL